MNDIIWVIYSLVLTTLGHSLYRINRMLKLKPVVNRILFGAMGSALYVGIYLYTVRGTPKFNYITMLLLFIVGYYIEPLVNIFDKRLPDVIDRLLDRVLPDITPDNKNDKVNKGDDESDDKSTNKEN